MAGSATFLNSELLLLSNEARKKYPDIKDASEKVLALIRTVKERAPDSFYQELAKTNEVLQPFLLACDTKQPKLVSLAVSCIQKLASSLAIADSPETLASLVHSLNEVSQIGVEVQLKLLQTIPILITSYHSIHQDLLASSLQIGFRLYAVKEAVVSNSAAAILRQLLIFLFDKVTPKNGDPIPKSILKQDAYLVFQDLCILASNVGQTTFLMLPSLSRTFALELLESILANHASIFKRHPEFSVVLCKSICPLVIKTFSEKHEYSQTIRLLRVVHLILAHLMNELPMECEVFLTLFLKNSEMEVPWVRAVSLEVLNALAEDALALVSIFQTYDAQSQGATIFTDWILLTQRLVLNLQNTVFLTVPKVPCLDQLDKTDPPNITEEYFGYLSMHSMFAIISSLEQISGDPKQADVLNKMLVVVWSNFVSCLSNLLRYSPESIHYIKTLVILCGQAKIPEGRDTYLTLLAAQVSSTADHPLQCIQAMLEIVNALSESLDEAWIVVFETISAWDRLRKTIMQLPSKEPPPSPAGSRSNKPITPFTHLPQSEVVSELDLQVKTVLLQNTEISNQALSSIFNALCQLTAPNTLPYAIEKLKQLIELHLQRVLKEIPELWTLVIHHFVYLTGHGASVPVQRQACEIVCDLVMRAFPIKQDMALTPLNELVCLSGSTSKLALETLSRLLQMQGPSFTSWTRVYSILEAVAGEETLVRLAFSSLELLCTDYFANQPSKLCVQTLRLYACQSADVNIALTCIRLLWNIADTSVDDETWIFVLHQLLDICLEKRPQVRNGCVTSLFRSIANHKSPTILERCYEEIVVSLLNNVLHCNTPNIEGSTAHLIYHHSRDTADKQWDETRALVLQGIEESISHHFDDLPETAFKRLMDHLYLYLIETNLEVKMAAAKLFHSFLKLPLHTLHRLEVYALFLRVTCKYHAVILVSSETHTASLNASQSSPSYPSLATTNSIESPKMVSPEKTFLVSHELLALLTRTLLGILPVQDDLLQVSSWAVLDHLTKVLSLSKQCKDHPKDLESPSTLQRAVLDVSLFLIAQHPLSHVFQFYAQWLTFSPSHFNMSSPAYPSFLAFSQQLLDTSLECSTHASGEAPPVFPEALNLILKSLDPFIISPHMLYAPVAQFLIHLLHHLPDSPLILAPVILDHLQSLAILFFNTRPTASLANMQQDVLLFKEFARRLPKLMENATVFWEALEASTRFSVSTPLDPPTPPVREAYCLEGLRMLFQLCQVYPAAWPVLLRRAHCVLVTFAADKAQSRIPLPRLREKELILMCSECIGTAYSGTSDLQGVPPSLQSHPSAHLLYLYHSILKCLKQTHGQPELTELFCQCLEKCGAGLGLSIDDAN